MVNQDHPVTITGQDGTKQEVPLGRSLAGNLTQGGDEQNFDWVLITASDAAAGADQLTSGRRCLAASHSSNPHLTPARRDKG